MSCEECRCDDIKHYNGEIDKLNEIYGILSKNFTHISDIAGMSGAIGDKTPSTYESKNKGEMAIKIRNITYGMDDRLRDALKVVSDEKGRINRILSDLHSEDHEYHEAERRSREKAAEEARHKANAAKAGL